MLAEFIIGESPLIVALRELILTIARTDLPVIIQGPTGVGKELVAQAIHTLSGRSGELVAFNVCAIADGMFEDALFGHVKGAFTGALRDSPGYLAEANGGTVFFDEIGGLAPANQAKLLRAIETGRYRPVGASRDRCSAFRTVAATNEPIDALVDEGRFRGDLAHRLAGVVIDVPPLAHRTEDVSVLARHFLNGHRREDGVHLDANAVAALMEHDWPGNVRELKYTLERAAAFASSGRLGRREIAAALRSRRGSRPDEVPPVANRHDANRRELVAVMEEACWSVDAAAARLGVDRTTVYRRLRRAGVAANGISPGRPEARNGSPVARCGTLSRHTRATTCDNRVASNAQVAE